MEQVEQGEQAEQGVAAAAAVEAVCASPAAPMVLLALAEQVGGAARAAVLLMVLPEALAVAVAAAGGCHRPVATEEREEVLGQQEPQGLPGPQGLLVMSSSTIQRKIAFGENYAQT